MDILDGGLSLLIGAVGAAIYSFFNKKGENIATKQDIEDITEKIKAVEHNFQHIASNKLEQAALKRRSIIEYFSAYNAWQQAIFNTIIDKDDYEINKSSVKLIQDARYNYSIKEGEMELLLNAPDFYEIKNKLREETIIMERDHFVAVLEMKNIGRGKVYNRNEMTEEDKKEAIKEGRELAIKPLEIQRKHNENRVSSNLRITPIKDTLIKILKDELDQLSKEIVIKKDTLENI